MGQKLTTLFFITIQINITASLCKKKTPQIGLDPLHLAAVPLINMPRFNSPSMNFQAAKGMKKFFLAIEL